MTKGISVARWAKEQIGKPYKEIDCIKLVVLSVRNGEGASGESKSYQCGGCNELWRSLNASGKYRYVTRRLELETAKSLGLIVPGALLTIWDPGYNQKYDDWEGDCSHIGIYVGGDVVRDSTRWKNSSGEYTRDGVADRAQSAFNRFGLCKYLDFGTESKYNDPAGIVQIIAEIRDRLNELERKVLHEN